MPSLWVVNRDVAHCLHACKPSSVRVQTAAAKKHAELKSALDVAAAVQHAALNTELAAARAALKGARDAAAGARWAASKFSAVELAVHAPAILGRLRSAQAAVAALKLTEAPALDGCTAELERLAVQLGCSGSASEAMG